MFCIGRQEAFTRLAFSGVLAYVFGWFVNIYLSSFVSGIIQDISFILHCHSSLTCKNKYLSVDSGGCFFTNRLSALIVPQLDASQRSRGAVRLITFVRELNVKRLAQS